MKSKKWLISLGLAVVLVVAFALPACEPTPTGYWYTPEGEKISFEINTFESNTIDPYSYTPWDNDIGIMVANDLADFGLNVSVRVLNSTTFWEYIYQPNLGGMETFIYAEEPSPWSDWVWQMMLDPTGWGAYSNPCWYNNARYTELYVENYLAPNLTAKKEILYEMQEILAEDLPMIYLVRPEHISAYRTDNWDNWFNEMGGLVSWINEYSIREMTPVGNTTQLNIGLLTLMDSLNMEQWILQRTHAGCLYLMLVYENLAFYHKVDEASLASNPYAAYEFVPKLATNYYWGHEGTNQTLTIDLQPGVKWHDFDKSGETLDADDVVYTMKYVIYPWGAIFPWSVNRPIDWDWVYDDENPNQWDIQPEDILAEATGPHQVKFTYVEGWHQNEDFFPSLFLWDTIVPQHVFTAEGAPEDPLSWNGNYTGTGPYMVEDFVPGDYLLLKRFDDYWGPLPEAEQILFKLYSGDEPLFLALEGGEIDAATRTASFSKIDDYKANWDLEVEIVPGLPIYYLGFNLHPTAGYAPLQDKVLRQAIAYAIDKQDIIDIALGGYGETADGWIYNESPMHNPDLPQYTFDPTAARNLLLAAGYTYKE